MKSTISSVLSLSFVDVPAMQQQQIKRLNDKLTLIFTGVGVLAGIKGTGIWDAIRAHPALATACLVLGVAPIQEFAFGNGKALWVIRALKWLLLWAVVGVAFCFVLHHSGSPQTPQTSPQPTKNFTGDLYP